MNLDELYIIGVKLPDEWANWEPLMASGSGTMEVLVRIYSQEFPVYTTGVPLNDTPSNHRGTHNVPQVLSSKSRNIYLSIILQNTRRLEREALERFEEEIQADTKAHIDKIIGLGKED